MSTPYQCRVCGGPCRAYAGSVHGWTCRACLADYIAGQRVPAWRTSSSTTPSTRTDHPAAHRIRRRERRA